MIAVRTTATETCLTHEQPSCGAGVQAQPNEPAAAARQAPGVEKGLCDGWRKLGGLGRDYWVWLWLGR